LRAIYLDYNATTPVRREVVEEMIACLAGGPGNPSSLHRFGREARSLRENARDRVAAAARCGAHSVVFTSGGTEANNLALRGVASRGGRHIVSVATEHEAVLETLEDLEQDGVRVTVLPVEESGVLDCDRLAASIDPDTALVSVMTANNETGVLQPIARVGEICRAKGILFHSDAVQCFGKSPFSFTDLPIDLASISSHKIGGPKGVGALLIRDGVDLRPQLTGGGQERALRPGTENLPGIVGFGKAAESAVADLEASAARLGALRDRLEAGIRTVFPAHRINGGEGSRLPNTSNVTFGGIDGEALLVALDLEGIAISTGAACNAGAAEPSHVLRAMGRSRGEAAGSIRFSLGSGTTDSDIEEVIRILPAVAARLANAGTSASLSTGDIK
jgi:cysteine desulfurase